MSMKTAEAARGRWYGILAALGVDPQYLRNVHGPCPICREGKDRWRWDDKMNGNFFCSQCGAGDGFTLLEKLYGWDFARAAVEVDRVVGNCSMDRAPLAELSAAQYQGFLKKLLESAGPMVPGCSSWRYIERRCGEPAGLMGLRHHPGIRHSHEWPGSFPALLGLLTHPDGSLASVHRTYLTPQGEKAAVDPVRKVMPGFPLDGAAVRLGPPQERLGIAEGIETAICAGKLHGLAVWAGISAHGILMWQPPALVRSVVIFGDNDTNFVGQAAAYEAAKKFKGRGLDVEIRIPAVGGTDWVDVWQESYMHGVA